MISLKPWSLLNSSSLTGQAYIQQPPQESVSSFTAASNESFNSINNLDLLSFSSQPSRLLPALVQFYILRSNLFFEESAARFSMYSRTLPMQDFDAPIFHGSLLIHICAFMIDFENMHHLFLIVQSLTNKAPIRAPIHLIHKVYFLRTQQLLFLLQWKGKELQSKWLNLPSPVPSPEDAKRGLHRLENFPCTLFKPWRTTANMPTH